MKKTNEFVARAAIVAALYVLLTFISNMFGLASGSIQVRISEALTILPIFVPEAVWGLSAGCLLSNILVGGTLPDIIFGTLATLVGAIGTNMLRKKVPFAIASPIVANMVIIPLVLAFSYNIRPIWLSVITVGIGEIISCGVLGTFLYFWLKKNKNIIM